MSLKSQLSLAGGVLAPALQTRVDFAKWHVGVKTMRNMFVMRHGGGLSRFGTNFVCRTKKGSSFQVRLIPFEFSDSQTYILEFGDLYMRVIKDGVLQTVNSQAISGITNANPAVLTYVGADSYANGDEVTVTGVVGAMANYVNGRSFKVAGLNAAANTFQLTDPDTGGNIDSTGWGAYTSGGTVSKIYEIVTPYNFALVAGLKFVQSGDVIFITDGSHAPQELTRLGDTNWTIGSMTIAPGIATPTGLVSGTPGAGTWYITALSATGEESLASASSTYDPASVGTIVFTWNAVANAVGYNMYTVQSGVTILTKSNIATNRYVEKPSNWTYNVSKFPYAGGTLFTASGGFSGSDAPSCCGLFQQRLFLGNTPTDSQRVFGSFIGSFRNFYPPTIDQVDSYPFGLSLVGKKVQSIQHFLDIDDMLLFTSQGVQYLKGNADGVITPTQLNPKRASGFGCSATLPPLEVNGSALYVTARGGQVRDLAIVEIGNFYRGNDISLFAAHLFISNTIVDWAFQQLPHSIVWAVLEDGTIAALTYIREQEIFAWHTHDTDGSFQQIACVPEGNEDVPYFVVDRTVNGATRRYIEQAGTREIPQAWTNPQATEESTVGDIRDFNALDCSLSYDGRNQTSLDTMTLTGGVTWDSDEALTLTLSNAANPLAFAASDVGNQIQLFDSDGDEIRFTITAFTSTTVVSGQANRTVPAALRSTATGIWAKAVETFSGLWHLEGRNVAVFADGFVVANPYNDAYDTLTVHNGTVTLSRPYGVVHIGLPFLCDLETLNVNSSDVESMVDKNKLISEVVLEVEKTRGIWAGAQAPTDDDTDATEKLFELKIRNLEGYDDAVSLLTGKASIPIQSNWNSNGRVFIRQIDPVPLSILAIHPKGLIPAKPRSA